MILHIIFLPLEMTKSCLPISSMEKKEATDKGDFPKGTKQNNVTNYKQSLSMAVENSHTVHDIIDQLKNFHSFKK